MTKALIITSVASMVDQFLFPSIFLLQDMGYDVHVACNFEEGNTCSLERVEELKRRLTTHKIKFYQIDFNRNVLKFLQNRHAYHQLMEIISKNNFDIVHCHSPIGGLLGRIAVRKARKNGTRVFYTAHGFHFYKGAPIKNWLLYYPVEKLCSYMTDVLITINQEDYQFAKKHMHAQEIHYVPGVGIDIDHYGTVQVDKNAKRKEIGLPQNAVAVLSVGELNENKNHKVIVEAIAKLQRNDIYYVLCGIGDQKEPLLQLAKQHGIEKQLILLGFRHDIAEINQCCDIFAFPSKREGLGLAALEAMAVGLPIVTSNVHGIRDYSMNGKTGFHCDPTDIDGFSKSITILVNDKNLRLEMGQYNRQAVKEFSLTQIVDKMKKIYGI